ncbi:glutathione S-transferase [Uliginosibacterium sp. H3]|uniref:Glutathione S-transferase n=1 Tax=Uliginosibacterium silvisoli TaxID=3114758 RepID=A0ABU6K127_9RHOO|nr:glutathione S-transferase [Uliginosibacterium sp. H3]
MSLPILYSFRRCPYAMRARLALKVSGIDAELREVALRSKPAEMLAVSPKGTVPVLVLPDGKVLEESLDIMRWALAQSDPQGWLAQAEHGAELIALNDGPFKQLLDRYKYADRYPERSAAGWREAAVVLHIAPLEARLQQTRFLLGETISLADMALMPFVRQFAAVDTAWFDGDADGLGTHAPFPAVRVWLQGLVDTGLFAAVMHKLPPWKADDPVTLFLD